jgi:predicted PurR-regulated permease PerM
MARADSQLKNSRFLLLASVCVVVAALYWAQDVLIPLALAILLSFLLAPLVHWLERWRIHRVAAVIIVVVLALALVAGIGYVMWNQLRDLAYDLPKYRQNIVAKVQAVRRQGGGVIGELRKNVTEITAAPATTQSTQPATQASVATSIAERSANPQPTFPQPGSEDNPLYVVPREPPPNPVRLIENMLGPLVGPLATAGIVIVFTIFILLFREDLRDRVIRLVGHGHLTLTTQALDDAASRISRYLAMQSLVNGSYGVAVALGLWFIGVPNPFLCGLLCGVIRFIPYIGPWIGASFPILLSIAVFPKMTQTIETVVMFVIIELLSNNIMEPWLYGSSTGMSEMAVLVSAVFWAWLWGPIGLLLSTPLTAIVVVLGKYVPQLEFLDILLGDKPVLAPQARVYQRWLALDQEEAQEVVEEFLATHSLEETYDQVVIPALAMAEQDRHRGNLDDDRQHFIRQAVREMIDELGDAQRVENVRADAADTERRAKSAAAESPEGKSRVRLPADCVINIVALPAHHESDELVAMMLTQLLQLQGYCATAASTTALASEMLAMIEKTKADIVAVSALPPAAVSHARYLCKRINSKFAEMAMVVGLWTNRGDLKKSKDRITCGEKVQLVTTLAEAMDRIQQLAQPLIVTGKMTNDETRNPNQ